MTLVLYLPYNDGVILMADTIGTADGKKYSHERKIRRHEKNNISVIYAVSGTSVAVCFYKFLNRVYENISTFSGHDLFKQIFEEYIEAKKEYLRMFDEYNKFTFADVKFVMRVLILRKNESDIDCAFIETFKLEEDFQCFKNFAMGEGRKYIEPNLELPSEEKGEEEVLQFGYHLMKYAHECDGAIGDPEVDGCDYVIISNTKDLVYMEEYKPQQGIDLERILYKFEEKNA